MIKVLVVDDSLFDRKLISFLLNKQEDIEVVGVAEDPYEARQQLAELKPDVITLDMLMPRMDGLTFLKKLMKHLPLPVVVVSSVTPANSKRALRALAAGAIEVISKPKADYGAKDMENDLVSAVRTAAVANVSIQDSPGILHGTIDKTSTDQSGAEKPTVGSKEKLIAIGSSTGGPKALEYLLPQFPENTPGVVIVQHMPEVFTKQFASRLNTLCRMEIAEAKDGDIVHRGKVLIAPGNRHMILEESETGYQVRIIDAPKVNHHRPSVDVLFDSVAKVAEGNTTGVILTGMGNDGAKGLLQIKNKGCYTIAQDEKSSVVHGMPKEAAKIGAAVDILPLKEIAGAILHHVKPKKLELIA
ncbi:MAG: chemotaxis response regulator protein-glutamate methylesterase [Gracilimonas sp.]|uniref:protein-glutamate methylesterase/protein-glutamine glutaminase n=1 Tax=Gracilimonas TaxID=649462 RepID=UPI001B0B777E|nr:chemotaxis response regulator protein-glutamate methylesterase [Gracilimonas sp.]MBO6586878.1 chemotaxis response regulator protein-glutamate methylesterase [Gracilimonas sp.]MBO6614634.1 chemotaxis response regulator protein-glutamate methylesterase [Gracilimonas sp.]